MNGTITINGVTGGTAPYQYSLDGITWQSSNIFAGLAGGNYTVRIRDNAAVCSVTIAVTVTQTGSLAATTNSTAASCTGINNGSIIIFTAGGTGPYTFALDGGAVQAGVLPYTFTNINSGNHTVLVTDLSSACNSGILNVIVSTGSGVNGIANSTIAACPAATNGTITVTALTGVAPFTFQLDGGALQAGSSPYTFNNVSPGAHTVIIRDNVGCTFTLNPNVSSGPVLVASANTTATSCSGAGNGTITITPTNGTSPYTYSLNGTAPVSGAAPYTFINVSAGAHSILVTDASGCVANIVNANVAVGAGVSGMASQTATSCPTSNNGTVTANATAGTTPFTYQLDGGAFQSGGNTYTFNNVAAGAHTVVIRDNAGCTSTINVNVTAGPSLTATTTSTPTSCTGVNNGTISVTPTSGSAPYNFSLDGGLLVTGSVPYTFTNVAAGPHMVIVTDAVGCVTNSINVSISSGAVLTATATSVSTSCSGASNGQITILPTGGAAPYAFSLDGAAAIVGLSPYTYMNVAAGAHTIVMTDGAGCVTNTINVNVAAGPVLTTTANKTDALCNGGASGIITVIQPLTGVGPYQYSLDGITWQASNIFSGLVAGTYTVFYRESNGCQGSQSIIVSEPAVLTASLATTPVICNGQSNGNITVTAVGGVLPYEYSINGGTTWQSNTIFNVAAGVYTITIRDVNNCITTQVVNVLEPAALSASSINTPASCNGGNDGLITVSANGGNVGYQYALDGITFQPSNTFNVGPGNYTVTLKDNLGCTINFNSTVGLGSNFILIAPPNPTICEGRSTQLQVNSNALQYSWTPTTGLSNSTIASPVANPTVTTQYVVTATLGRCSGNTTVIVNVNAAPIPNAGPDTIICKGQTYQLQGTGGTVYSWSPSTNLNNSSIANPVSSTTKNIIYNLSIVSDINGCASLNSDQVRINVSPPITVKTFPYDTISYSGAQFQLFAAPSDSDVINYSWTPSTGLNNPTIANPIVTVGAIGDVVKYQVITSTLAGCSGEGYVTVRVYKGPDIYVPTGFTPNGDGKNDRFTPLPVGMKSYKYFRVFNRWGQLVFSTTSLQEGWDGKLAGKEQQNGVFVWTIEGVTKDDRIITKKGTVALIR